MGRLYLSKDPLDAAFIPVSDPKTMIADPRIDMAARVIAAKARLHYAAADGVMALRPPGVNCTRRSAMRAAWPTFWNTCRDAGLVRAPAAREPVMLAVLNTALEEGSMDLAGAVVRESLALGGMASRPRIASPTLAAFAEPAIAYLKAKGGDQASTVAQGHRGRGGRAKALQFTGGVVELGLEDRVFRRWPRPRRATPAGPSSRRTSAPSSTATALPEGFDWTKAAPMTGLIGGTVEWVFVFHDRISVTISGADRLVDDDREDLARRLWADVARTLSLGDAPLPAWQIVKEKRATFAATPAVDAIRPHAKAGGLSNLLLAGDWTQTGLPATIEGALRSGETAARLV